MHLVVHGGEEGTFKFFDQLYHERQVLNAVYSQLCDIKKPNFRSEGVAPDHFRGQKDGGQAHSLVAFDGSVFVDPQEDVSVFH